MFQIFYNYWSIFDIVLYFFYAFFFDKNNLSQRYMNIFNKKMFSRSEWCIILLGYELTRGTYYFQRASFKVLCQ